MLVPVLRLFGDDTSTGYPVYVGRTSFAKCMRKIGRWAGAHFSLSISEVAASMGGGMRPAAPGELAWGPRSIISTQFYR